MTMGFNPPGRQTPAPPPEGGDVTDPRPLHPKVVVLWRAAGAIGTAVTLLAVLVATLIVGPWALTGLLVVAAAAVLGIWWLPSARYRSWRWRMTDRALELEYGVFWRQVRAVPYFRIQHIDIDHGPLDRWLGLAQLQVHTASITGVLPGIAVDDAPDLRTSLIDRAAHATAEVGNPDAV